MQDPNANGALGYDTYNIPVDAIRRAGSDDPKAIRMRWPRLPCRHRQHHH